MRATQSASTPHSCLRPAWNCRMLAGALALFLPAGMLAQLPCDSAWVRKLPLIERPALSDTNATLVVLLTGDGAWAGADEKVSDGLRARGAAVVGLNMRAYLGDRKTPEQASADVGCIAEHYGRLWRRSRLMLLGYSRGADIAPFVAARWPESLRARLNMVALVSLNMTANFKFHFIDLVKETKRDDDMLVAPELRRLAGLRVVCVYGLEEQDSGCLGLDPKLVQAIGRPGGHRLTEGFEGVANILAAGLRPSG